MPDRLALYENPPLTLAADSSRWRYFVYVRKSSEPDDRQVLSIESQKQELLQAFGHLTVVEIIEEAQSAKAPGRPRFERMMKRLEKGEAEGIIAWHPDRLARNSVDGGRVIYDLDQGKLLDLKFPQYHFENSPEGKWVLGIIFGQSKYFVDKLSKDVKRGLRAKLAMGWRPGVAPIGYLNNLADHKGTRTLIPDPNRFPLVRRIWDLMLTGAYPPSRILEIATQEWGLRTVERHRCGGSPLSYSGIYRLLTNPFYHGAFEYGGQLYPGKHEPMISEGEFWKVQEMLGRKGRSRPKVKRSFAYTGLIRCGECGCMVTAEERWKHNKTDSGVHHYVYYHCTKKKRALRCGQPSIEVKELERQMEMALAPITVADDFLEWTRRHLQEIRQREKKQTQAARASVETAYKSAQRQLDELLNVRLRGLIGDGEFEAKRRELARERDALQSQIENPAAHLEKGLELVERTCQFAHDLKNRFNSGTLEEKRMILETVGSNLLLDGRKLTFEPVAPFCYLRGADEKSNWRGIVKDVRTFCLDALQIDDSYRSIWGEPAQCRCLCATTLGYCNARLGNLNRLP